VSDEEAAPPDFHLLLDREEVPAVAQALRLLIADEAHQPTIRALAREVLAGLEAEPGERGVLSLPLSATQMKITHSAVRLLVGDLQRGQAQERETLQQVIDKLPDEHVMRAIEL
jgi:hypothetical protein